MNTKKLTSLLGCLMLCYTSAATSAELAQPGKRLRLYLGAYANSLADPRFLAAIDEYDVDGLELHRIYRDGIAGDFPVPGFPRLASKVDAESVARFRKWLEPYHRKGLDIMISGPEPVLPPDFFEAYPEAKNVSNGLLWKFLEARTAEVSRQLPEVSTLRCHFWEAPILNDSNYFRELFWAEPKEVYSTPSQYYAPVDYLKEVIVALSRGAQAAHKRYVMTGFSHKPWQEKLVIEAIHAAGPGTPFDMAYRPLSGDFDPYRPTHPAISSITDRSAMLQFDGFGEYVGLSFMPYANPDQMQYQLQYALARNPAINAVCIGTSFAAQGDMIFGTLNEVNLYALAQFARNPDVPIEKVWRDWAEPRFGKEAAPKVISALKRTCEIGNLTYYFKGVWIHNHSTINSSLRYMEAKILQTGRGMIEWKPEDIESNVLIRELIENPSERTIEVAVADRAEALRLNRLSMEDVEAAGPALPAAEYANLKDQFTLQRHFIETSIPHIEAFLRYWIAKKSANPPPDNMAKLEKLLTALDAKAAQIEEIYKEKVPILTGKDIRKYTREIRQSVKTMPAPERGGY